MMYKEPLVATPENILEYLRKSRSDDPLLTVEEVLQKHESILNDFAERNLGGKIPFSNVFREVASSETIDDRPEMLRLLKAIESPRIKAILVVEVQRLSRGDLEDAGRLIKLLRYTNTQVITPTKTYDLRDEYDRDAFERELKRGNEYLEYFKKIQARGRLQSVAEGNYIGNVAPYGYDKITIKEGKKKCHTLAENKEQADVVRMIFDMFANQGMTKQAICYHLDGLGIKPPRGKHWSPYAMKDMLENVHYIGKVKWNWRKTIKVVEDGEVRNSRPKTKIGEFLIYEGKHDGIISEELFNKAQEVAPRSPRKSTYAKVRNPLAGLMWCPCGHSMQLRTYMNKGKEKSKPRLMCIQQNHCKTSSVLYEEAEERVCDILEACIEDFEFRLENNEGDSVKLHTRLIKNLENKKKELEAKELSQWEAQSHPDPSQRMPQHIFQRLNENLLREKEEVQQALCKAYESMPEPVDYEEKLVMFRDALDALRNPELSAEEKNKYLKKVIERIDYARDKSVRITKKNCEQYGFDADNLTTGGRWYAPPFEMDVQLKI